MIQITKNNFNDYLEKSVTKPLLIDFWAPWCGPCRMLGPVIEKLADEVGDSAIVGKINVDEEYELSEKFGVTSIPTVIVIKDKKITSKSVGFKSIEQLKEML